MATPSHTPQPLARTLHKTLANHKGPVHVARYAKGSAKYVLTGGQDRTIRLWNPALGTEIKVYSAHGYEVLSVAVSHDNSKFGSCGGDRSVFLWDVTTGQTIRRFAGHMGKVNTVDFNAEATVLVSGSFDTTVRFWDMRSQSSQAIQVLDEAGDAIQTIHVSPTTVITGSVDGYVRTYDLRKGELRSDYIGHPVTAVVPTQDTGTYLVTTLDSTVRLMDSGTGKLLNKFDGHSVSQYRCRACFGHGEGTVVCGDENGAVWAWDLLEGHVLAPDPPPRAHEKVILWTEHHPTESGELITASADGTVKVWSNAV